MKHYNRVKVMPFYRDQNADIPNETELAMTKILSDVAAVDGVYIDDATSMATHEQQL
jgi:hypothetical protein